MKNFNSTVPQEFVRNPLEISDKGIVSYIPFKFAFKTRTFLALCQKLPTAYFSVRRANFTDLEKLGAKIRQTVAKIRQRAISHEDYWISSRHIITFIANLHRS